VEQRSIQKEKDMDLLSLEIFRNGYDKLFKELYCGYEQGHFCLESTKQKSMRK